VKLEARLTRSQLDHLARAFTRGGDAATDGWVKVMREIPQA
jgi:hypothetical protein